MKIIKNEKGNTYKIQGNDVFMFALTIFFATLVSAGTLKILGVI